MPGLVSDATRAWEANVYWPLNAQCAVWDPKGKGVDVWECIRALNFANTASEQCLLALCHTPMTPTQRFASLHASRVVGQGMAASMFAYTAAARVSTVLPPTSSYPKSRSFTHRQSRAPVRSRSHLAHPRPVPPLQIAVITNPQQHGTIAVRDASPR